MNFLTDYGLITVTNEPTYLFSSTDNVRSYAFEIPLTDSIWSKHGLSLNGERIVIVGGGLAQPMSTRARLWLSMMRCCWPSEITLPAFHCCTRTVFAGPYRSTQPRASVFIGKVSGEH